jgi:hypothetical protein
MAPVRSRTACALAVTPRAESMRSVHLPRRESPLGDPQHVQGVPEYRALLEPWVRLAPADGNGPHVVARFQHLQDGLDVFHALGEPLGFPLVVLDLAAQLGMELFEGEFGVVCWYLGSCHARNVGAGRSKFLWRLRHNTALTPVFAGYAERCSAGPGPFQTLAFGTVPGLQRTTPQELRAALRPGQGGVLVDRSVTYSPALAP